MKILTPQNYFEQDEYMSVSSFKLFQRCELMGLVGFGEPSTAMLIGSYVDAFVEGTLEQFKEDHPEIFSSRGATKGELKTDYKYADKICEFISDDPIFSQFMSGEKQTIMSGEIGGVPFKIKMDSYSPSIAINDLKVLASITNKYGAYIDFVTPWGYDLQMAGYQEIVRQNTGEKLPCYICAVTKEDPIDSLIVNIPQHYLDMALYNIESKVSRFYNVKMGIEEPIGCGICGVCRSKRTETKIVSLSELMG